MPRLPIKRPYLLAAIAIVCWIGLAFLSVTPICHDRAFVDEHTGARKGYRQWFTGGLSNHWYRGSALETFMRSRYPDRLAPHWTSYGGTGRSIFGSSLLFSHGMPGPILELEPEELTWYCRGKPDEELLRLYETLSKGDTNKTRELVDQIWQAIRDAG